MRVSRKTSFAAGAMAALVLGSGTAYAATGGSLILGMSNKAGATSVLSNKNGVALSLNSKSGTPSLKVNRSVKVPNLNADMVDGLSAGSFALAKGNTGHVTGLTTPWWRSRAARLGPDSPAVGRRTSPRPGWLWTAALSAAAPGSC
jgi:hypothetical protein